MSQVGTKIESQPSCSVVIRCCNEGAHIGKLLTGIIGQTLDNVEIIIVDSGSTDQTLEIAAQFPTRILHIEPERFSFGRSLNLGCEAATGEFIVIVSAHVYPLYDSWLENLLAPFANEQVALCYGRQVGNEISCYSERQVMEKWFPETSVALQDHPFCNNANAAIRAELFRHYRYDEGLTGLEDLDWAKRVMTAGHRLSYCADAEVVHVHQESWRQVFNRYKREAMALKLIMPQQNMGLLEFVQLYGSNLLNDCRHAWRDRLAVGRWLEIPAFRLMQFWGTYRGFRTDGHMTKRLRERFYYPRGITPERSTPDESKGRPINYDASLGGFDKRREARKH
jgi:glycosyltransferase involved in cell wall biosynthesis